VQDWNVDSAAASEEEMVAKYSKLVRVCARPYFLVGGDGEDLIQEGMLGLLSAIRSFDPARGVKFETYAGVCVRRRIFSAIKRASGLANNSFISLESQRLNDFPEQWLARNPEELVIARERVLEIADRLYDGLSKFESAVLKLFLEGRTYDEMSRLLGKPYKSVDNAVQRIRRKRKNGDTR
jgi:RNA polymerase sporulation-specific sigma factor